ncbi:MAG: TonB-dependent receptor, partial [Bacteroidota bacterium]
MPKLRTLCFLLILFLCLQASAQILQGRVVSPGNRTLKDAYIVHLSTDHHAHTTDFGVFVLPGVRAGDSIQVSHIGFQTQKLVIEDPADEIKIILQETPLELGAIVVSRAINPLNLISKMDLQTAPVNSSQEVLRKVPGLFIGQHAGGGKAEQIFLRGFDIDHGTDINITVDGLPVNMVSHAHGQGYSDLHFLIPETIERIDFNKGPYNADKGNFATAGYVNFQTKRRLEESSVLVQGGRFNTLRSVAMLKLMDQERNNWYLATEYIGSDGPFEASQNFNRVNLMSRFTAQSERAGDVSVMASFFDSQWDASGQIPNRAVASGQITRFGALDSTEGGSTSRFNLAADHSKIVSNKVFVKNRAYYSRYDFELYSNFTFFLEDSINGDQIRQREKRDIFGIESVLNLTEDMATNDLNLQVGAGLRVDNVRDNELSKTRNRTETLDTLQLGDVQERNIYAFANLELDFGRFILNPSVRVDAFNFLYQDALTPLYDPKTATKAVVSPKLNLIYNFSDNLQAYLKTGIGFHSNDARVVLGIDEDGSQIDNLNENILPLAIGADLGVTWKPAPRLVINGALWYLFLQQEFVYVGDAGIVEPSGETVRLGFDLGLRYQINDWLYFNGDVNFSRGRAIEEAEGEDFIPLAPVVTSMGGLSVRKGPFESALSVRYLEDRPANEDESIIAEGYTIFDLNANYRVGPFTFGVWIENLFDAD